MSIKKYLVLCAVGLASCGGNSDQKSKTSEMDARDTTLALAEDAPQPDGLYCFIRTEGTRNQDTTTVYFVVEGNQVEGEMNWVPYEKDSRRGKLKGTISGNEITAVWTYMQEGMQDSIPVLFRLSPQQLAQKPLKANAATGRQETDKTVDYSLLYTPMDDWDPSMPPSL